MPQGRSEKTAGEKTSPENTRENSLLSSILLFALFLGLFFAGLYAFAFGTLDNAWPFVIGLALVSLAFWVPLTFMGRSDSGQGVMVDTNHRKPTQGH